MKFSASSVFIALMAAAAVDGAVIKAKLPYTVSDMPCPPNHHNWLYCWMNGKDIGVCNGKIGFVTNEYLLLDNSKDGGCSKMAPGAVLGPLR